MYGAVVRDQSGHGRTGREQGGADGSDRKSESVGATAKQFSRALGGRRCEFRHCKIDGFAFAGDALCSSPEQFAARAVRGQARHVGRNVDD